MRLQSKRKRATPSKLVGEDVSLRDQAYEDIKQRIISTRYRPGTYLSAAGISSELGHGLTPIAQALSRLALEGMVEIIPRKGAIVRPVSLDEILQIVDVRLINEMRCAELAAQRATQADLVELERILTRATALLVRERDIEGLIMCDRDFHLALSRAARNPILGEILRTLHERTLRIWFNCLPGLEHFSVAQSEHRAVLDAIVRRDARAASAAMSSHLESVRATIAKLMS